MTNPIITMRPNPHLVKAAQEQGWNLREILEEAIKKRLDKCPMCGQKIKKK